MRILAIIPARGGSKGVPYKNIKELGGKPLIQYSIEAAQKSKYITDIVISTDDQKIAEVAINLGISVPSLRPPELASDTAKSIDVVRHVILDAEVSASEYDAILLLQPTTPFRTHLHIDEAINIFTKNNHDSLISVESVPHQYHPNWVFKTDNNNLATYTDETVITRRQSLPDVFVRNGAIYITSRKVLLEKNSFFGERLGYLRMESKFNVNIDTMSDWGIAEQRYNELFK